MNLIEGSIRDGVFAAGEGLRLPLPGGTMIGDREAVVYGIRPQHIAVGAIISRPRYKWWSRQASCSNAYPDKSRRNLEQGVLRPCASDNERG
jgi:hypothetical protein